MKHRGKIFKGVVQSSGMRQTEIAKRAGVHKGTINEWFNNEELSWDNILKVGRVINHDFTQEFPELKELIIGENDLSMVNEPTEIYESLKAVREENNKLRQEIYALRKKHDELSEKYIKCLEKINKCKEKS